MYMNWEDRCLLASTYTEKLFKILIFYHFGLIPIKKRTMLIIEQFQPDIR